MALYIIDDTGEAVEAGTEQYTEWCGKQRGTLVILARHDIIECRDQRIKVIAIDAIKHPHHSGKVLATVVTRFLSNTYLLVNNEDYQTPPWETGVLDDDPRYFMHSRTRAQAWEAHKMLVNLEVKQRGGRILI